MNPIPELWTQFCIAAADVRLTLPERWKSTRLHNWNLSYSDSTPYNIISTRDGLPVGWLIGYSIDSTGKRIAGDYRSQLDLNQFSDAKKVDELLLEIEGRFFLALVHPEIEKAYINTGGDLSAVYRKDISVVASTPTAAHFDDLSRFVAEQTAKPELLPNQYLPAGLTYSSDTSRILPNHYLNLKTRTTHRYWPTDALPEMSETQHREKTIQIADHLRSRIESLAEIAPLTLGLSGGRDCRMLLSGFRNIVDRLHAYTFIEENSEQPWDVSIGQFIANQCKLNHTVIKVNKASGQIKKEYLFRVGYCNNSGKANDFYLTLKNNYPENYIMLVGYGGEMQRGTYYRNFIPTERPDLHKVMKTLRQAPTEEHLAAVEAWAKSVPANLSAPMFYDLLYWELRFGCWAAPQMYGAAKSYTYISPMTHGKLLRPFLMQTVAMKHQLVMYKKLLSHNWPGLEQVPHNDLIGWSRTWRHVKGMPGRAVGKVKRILGKK